MTLSEDPKNWRNKWYAERERKLLISWKEDQIARLSKKLRKEKS